MSDQTELARLTKQLKDMRRMNDDLATMNNYHCDSMGWYARHENYFMGTLYSIAQGNPRSVEEDAEAAKVFGIEPGFGPVARALAVVRKALKVQDCP